MARIIVRTDLGRVRGPTARTTVIDKFRSVHQGNRNNITSARKNARGQVQLGVRHGSGGSMEVFESREASERAVYLRNPSRRSWKAGSQPAPGSHPGCFWLSEKPVGNRLRVGNPPSNRFSFTSMSHTPRNRLTVPGLIVSQSNFQVGSKP
jgi:hypothetical protein